MTIEHDGEKHWTDTRGVDTTAAQYHALLGSKQQSGFEDMPDVKQYSPYAGCLDMNHNPPMYMHVPVGKRYRNVCPSCGMITYVQSLETLC